MNDADRKRYVLRMLRAFERFYGENGMLGPYRDELEDIAREIGRKLSKNKRALDALAHEEEPLDVDPVDWHEFVPKDDQ